MRILVIRFSSLGDLVTLEPTFRAIRNLYPSAEIDFITSGLGKSLYSDTKYFDNIIVHKTFGETIRLLKSEKFNVSFNLHCNSLSHRLLFFIKSEKIVNLSSNWIEKLFHLKRKGKSLKTLLLNAGIKIDKLEEYFTRENVEKIKMPFIKSNKVPDNYKSVAISIGSSEKWKSKQWGVERYSSLVSLLQKNNFTVILVGTELELAETEIIADENKGVVNLVNKTSLSELKNVLGSVDLYVGNDSGPSHIAASVGTNTVTIFGSTDKQHCVKFMNYLGNHSYLVPLNISCHPCYKQQCPTNMECMDSIPIKKVFNEVMEMLNEKNT